MNNKYALQMLLQSNPQARQIMHTMQAKTPLERKTAIENMCRERGITVEELARSIGITIPSER